MADRFIDGHHNLRFSFGAGEVTKRCHRLRNVEAGYGLTPASAHLLKRQRSLAADERRGLLVQGIARIGRLRPPLLLAISASIPPANHPSAA